MVQMKITAAALIAAAAIAPAVATSSYAEDSLVAYVYFKSFSICNTGSLCTSREIEEYGDFVARAYELEERGFFDDEEELAAREFDDFDLEAREPFMGMNHAGRWLRKKFGHGHQQQQQSQEEAREFDEELEAREFDEEFEAREFDDELDAREFDEFDLEAREPFMGMNHAGRWLRKKFSHGHQQQQQDQQSERREFDEELEAREFDEELEARDFDDFELDAREPDGEEEESAHHGQGGFHQGVHHHGQGAGHRGAGGFHAGGRHPGQGHRSQGGHRRQPREYDELLTRHYDELLEREMGLASDVDVVERDFEGEYELMQREYDELVSREPGVVDWFKNLFKSKKQREQEKKQKEEKKKAAAEKKAAEAAKKSEADDSAAAPAEAREYYDIYDELD
ncbi:hypothetical protein CVT25_009824 [Psilocybe cyanescens]|uniref:Uncharacterized protein n=1 Tax=Psilocybe cyanescens TaxID=93625 RepID=A0A409X823_PSICY|nr:hypothetical protein CVT25_009824 [Psilocybe cyanescens]